MKYEFFAGSYGSRQEETIFKFFLDTDTGQIRKLYGYAGAENPSWLTLHSGNSVLYAVEELSPEGNVCAFGIKDHGLELLSRFSTKGADPCHICLDEKEKCLLAANYSSGSLAVFRLDKAGIPLGVTDFWQDTGYGANPARQEGPHMHFTKVRGGQVFAVNLGTDRVRTCRLDADNGRLEDVGTAMELPAGAGPRHLEFHPEIEGLVYAACELGSQVAVFRQEEGKYVPGAMESTLPEGFCGENTVAAIRIHGDSLFVSNRGHDSIAAFSIQKDGGISLRQIVPTGGKVPRDFAIMGEYMVAANQGSDEITVLRIRPENGLLEQTGISAPMNRPVCICPIPAGGCA